MTTELYLLDANVLVALANPQHLHHAAAHRWFATVRRWATTPLTEAAFVRLQSNPMVIGGDVPMPEVLGALRAMRAMDGHVFLPDDSSLAEPAIDLIAMIGHRQVTDLHLVNLAARAGARLATFDTAIRASLIGSDRDLVHLVPA